MNCEFDEDNFGVDNHSQSNSRILLNDFNDINRTHGNSRIIESPRENKAAYATLDDNNL